MGGGGGGASLCPPPDKCLYNFATLRCYIFVGFQLITFKRGSFTHYKVLFPVMSMDFPDLSMSKVEKNVKGSI